MNQLKVVDSGHDIVVVEYLIQSASIETFWLFYTSNLKTTCFLHM